MRIGIEAQRLFRPKKHGVEIVILEIIRQLQRIDTENEYFVYVRKDEDVCLQSTPNFTIRAIDGCLFPIWEQIILPLAAKKDRCELLHCSCNTAPLFTSIPLLLTVHDVIYLEKSYLGILLGKGTPYQRFGNIYRRFVVPRVFKKSKQVITVSHFEKKRIDTLLSKSDSKVTVVYNSVDPLFQQITQVDEQIVKPFNLPKHFALFLGNTDPKKNSERLLEAFFIFLEKYNLELDLVVTDLSINHIQKIAHQLGYERWLNRIHGIGYVTNSKMPHLYLKSDLFLCPSIRESFGIPVVEAMTCGVPVLTSNTSSLPEISGDAAFFIDPCNPTEIADGINLLISSPETREKLIVKGKENAKRYSWKESATMTLNIYTRLRV